MFHIFVLFENHIMELNDKIVIYQVADGETAIDVKLENETVWLSANQMAELFERDAKTIRKHINNVFSEEELLKKRNTHFLRVPFSDKPVPFYSLDVIISVGYRVKSKRGTQFRIWANRILKEYLVKGYGVNNRIATQKYEELCQLVQVLCTRHARPLRLPTVASGANHTRRKVSCHLRQCHESDQPTEREIW